MRAPPKAPLAQRFRSKRASKLASRVHHQPAEASFSISAGDTQAADTPSPGVAESSDSCCKFSSGAGSFPGPVPHVSIANTPPPVMANSSSPSSKALGKRPLSPPPTAPPTGTQEQASSSAAWHPNVPKRMLHVFSGPGGRADGLRRFMWDVYQCEVVEFDTLVDEQGCDLLRDDVFADLMERIRAGEFFSVIIGTPCSTSAWRASRRMGCTTVVRGSYGTSTAQAGVGRI